MDDQHYMQHALALAEKAGRQEEVPVGAVLVLGDEVVGEGWNQPISACDPTAHAEVVALRMAARRLGNYRLPNSTLYVTLEPCLMCMGALLHARVERLVFGAFDPKIGAVRALDHRIKWIGGCEAQACGELLQAFFKARR